MKQWCATAALLLGAAYSINVNADNVTLTPQKDNTLFSMNPTHSNGAGDNIFAGRSGPGGNGDIKRGLLMFDVAGAVPEGSTIASATLTLYLAGAPDPDAVEPMTLHRVLEDWGEGDSEAGGGTGAPAGTDDATWTHAFWPDVLWTVEGGPHDKTPSSSADIGGNKQDYTWISTGQTVADVQAWLDNPKTNYGWMIRGTTDGSHTARRFASREEDEPSWRPRLHIEYDPPTGRIGDINGDGYVDAADLAILLGAWGVCPDPPAECPADLDGDGDVDSSDLAILLGNWT